MFREDADIAGGANLKDGEKHGEKHGQFTNRYEATGGKTTCSVCHVEASEEVKMKRCAGCQSAETAPHYCSNACAKIGWKKHKLVCAREDRKTKAGKEGKKGTVEADAAAENKEEKKDPVPKDVVD